MAAINRRVRIYRKLVPADTFASLASTEKLEFNVSQDTKIANGWTTGHTIPTGRGIAEITNPNQNFAESQDTGLDDKMFEVRGVCSRPDVVAHAFIIGLNAFLDGDQENNNLPNGRFAVEFDADPNNNLISSATQGLKVEGLEWIFEDEEPNVIHWKMTFKIAKAAV